jgi:NitT/TauT family transport system substrate-binding protein
LFSFFDHGLDLYGSSLLVRPEFAASHPDTVKKFLAATVRGMQAMLADKDTAISSLLKRDPTMDPKIERERLDLMIQLALQTPSVEQHGASFVDPARMDRGLAIVAQAFNVTPAPKTADVFTDAYLPADRKLKF